ncbi:hypothetical protein [Streptomyces harbinensis]|uniref:hypothetical protein n=1 Tax=Streptomyces harbinensis TaxID=1176198 RepID=UPI0034DE531D
MDTRLIHTAVIGGRDSDQPVILPEEPHNLDEFRRRFGTDRFWCGTLLGGCGAKLMTKRYETKVCHFSHYPGRTVGRAACSRTANGVDSADHLFIKLHVTRWLADQGHAAQARLRSFREGPGDAVEFWLRATNQHLRFQLRPENYWSWRKAANSLAAKEGHVEWVFGPDDAITRDMLAREGYALRVRCETKGNERIVLVGTMAEGRAIVWEALEQCRMTRSGLVTPALDELRRSGLIREGGMGRDPFPGSLPLRGSEIVFAVDSTAIPPADSAFNAVGRQLISGFIKPSGSRIIQAQISLPEEVPAPTEQYVYRLAGAVRLLVADPVAGQDPPWAVRADSLTQLNGLDAERTGLWRPSVALDKRLDTSVVEANAHTGAVPAQVKRSRTATVLREALEDVAREGITTTWRQLARVAGLDLAHLPDPRRRKLLVEVDTSAHTDGPLLCVLILTESGRPLPYLGTVLRLLRQSVPVTDSAVRQWSTTAIKATHEAYQRNLTPARTTDAKKDNSKEHLPTHAELRKASRTLVNLRTRLREAAQVDVRADDRRAASLLQAMQLGEAHTQQYHAARRRTQTLRMWQATGDGILGELESLVGQPTTAPATTDRTAATDGLRGQPVREHTTASPTGRAESHRQVSRAAEKFVAAQISSDLEAARQIQRDAELIRSKDLTVEVRDRLHRLLTDVQDWIRTQELSRMEDAGSANNPPKNILTHAQTEARAEFEWLIKEIRAAQKDGDLVAVDTARRLAGPVYARALSPSDREKHTPFMRELKVWCHEQDPKKKVDPPLRQIRQLLAEMGHTRKTRSHHELTDMLEEIGRIRHRLAQPLPDAEDRQVRQWHMRLHAQRTSEAEHSTPTQSANPRRNLVPRKRENLVDRLPVEALEKLAHVARTVLTDSARNGGLLTWGDLRLRMEGGLPHLHPDDQGELLVAVDRETPADEPLLSTLIISSDSSLHWLYRHVRFSLGRERIPGPDLEHHWATEVLRLRQIWRHK